MTDKERFEIRDWSVVQNKARAREFDLMRLNLTIRKFLIGVQRTKVWTLKKSK